MVPNNANELAVERRMELFQALVETQDQGIDTVRSRQRVAKRFGVTERDVRRIEEEGLTQQWPPL
jgi:hypothetical protein